MNANQAKSIRLSDLMDRLGYKADKTERGGTELKFASPFRKERDASFNLNISKNVWFDFGENCGGNTLDFAIKYLESRGQPCFVKNALSWLKSVMGHPDLISNSKPIPTSLPLKQSFSFSQQQQFENGNLSKLQVLKAHKIQNPFIFEYLHNRCISQDIANRYLIEIHYKNVEKNKNFFGFGMENLSENGYELRSASDSPKFKTAFNRDISVIQGGLDEKCRIGAVNVFEGMLDALSLFEALNVNVLKHDTIIMHSLASFKRTVQYIQEQNYQTIHLFLDNNDSGEKTTSKFVDEFGDRVEDQSILFFPHEDMNDALQANAVNLDLL